MIARSTFLPTGPTVRSRRLQAAVNSGPYQQGPVGPTRYIAGVGTAIASAVERNLVASLERMGPRYFHIARTLQRDAAERGEEAPSVAQRDLIPSHPLDWVVAGSMCEPGVVEVAPGPEDIAPGAVDPNRNRRIRFEWQGGRGLWNYVKVTSPTDPTPEEVAKNVLGRHELAYRLIVAPPLYGIPEDLAENIDEARAHRPAALGTRPAGSAAPVEHDPMVALGTSAAGDEAALAAAGRAIEARQQGNPAQSESTQQPPVDRRALLHALSTSQVQIQSIASIVEPFALDEHLAPSRAWLAAKRTELPAAPDDAVRLWAEVLRGQQHALVAIATDLSRLARQFQEQTRNDPWAGTVQLAPAQRDLFVAYLRAAAVAHIPDAGMAALADARGRQRDAIPAALESLLAQAVGKVEQLKYVTGNVEREAQASREIFGLNIRQRHQDLMRRVADLRIRLQLGQVEPAEVEALHGDCDALVFEAEVLANLGSVRQVKDVIEQLEESNWVAAAGQIEDLEPLRQAAYELKMGLSIVHTQWMQLQKDAAALSATLRTQRLSEDQAAAMARALVDERMTAIKAKLAKLASDDQVRAFLQKAYDEIEDAQQKAMILQICVLIGVTIASAAVGGATSGAASTLFRGVQGGRILAGLTGIVAESATVSSIQSALTGDSFVEAMTIDLGQNLLTLGALAAWDEILAGTRLGNTITRAERGAANVADDVVEVAGDAASVGRAGYIGAKGVQLTGNALIIAGTQVAGMQAESEIRQGRPLTMDEILADGQRAIAMMIGTGVLTRLSARPLEKLKAMGARGAELYVRSKHLQKLAAKVEQSGDPAEALELLRADRALVEAELAEYQRLATEQPENLSRMGLSPELVEAYRSGAAQQLAAVDAMTSGHVAAAMGLDVVVPGHTYSGPPDRVAALVADYERRGYRVEVETLPEGNTRHRLTSQDGRTQLEVVTTLAPATGSRLAVVGSDTSAAEAANWLPPPPPGTLDVFIHGSIDDFEVNVNGTIVKLDHRRLARLIEKSGTEFDRVRLIACKSGGHDKAIAQHLANKLGVEVDAPTDTIWVNEDGTIVIGPDPTRNTGRWRTYTPQKSSLRYTPTREPAPRDAIAEQRQGDDVASVPFTRRDVDDPSSALPAPGKTSNADPARQRIVEQIAQVPLAMRPQGATANDQSALDRDTYYVTRADGARLLGLVSALGDVRVREYRKGFLIRRGREEWYFEYHDRAMEQGAEQVERSAGEAGLPAPNAATIEIWGFRGVRSIGGRAEAEWTQEQRQDVAHATDQDPLLYAGHVGVSVDGGQTIYGFTPLPPHGMPLPELLSRLKGHEAFPGALSDDTRIFRLAEKMAAEKGWDTTPISAVELVDPAKHREVALLIEELEGMHHGEHGIGYSFPLRDPENGEHFQESNGFCGADVRNCASFPEKLGIPIPEPSGNLKRYIPELEKWATAESPMDFRTKDEP